MYYQPTFQNFSSTFPLISSPSLHAVLFKKSKKNKLLSHIAFASPPRLSPCQTRYSAHVNVRTRMTFKASIFTLPLYIWQLTRRSHKPCLIYKLMRDNNIGHRKTSKSSFCLKCKFKYLIIVLMFKICIITHFRLSVLLCDLSPLAIKQFTIFNWILCNKLFGVWF
jgi:hypothetical protein